MNASEPPRGFWVFVRSLGSLLSLLKFVAMGKTGKSKMLKKEVDHRVKKIDKALPFQPSPRVLQPRSMKDRQQLWVLSGLKHLGAPVVLWVGTCLKFFFSCLVFLFGLKAFMGPIYQLKFVGA